MKLTSAVDNLPVSSRSLLILDGPYNIALGVNNVLDGRERCACCGCWFCKFLLKIVTSFSISYTPLPRSTIILPETLVTLFLDGGSCSTDGTPSRALELCLRLPRSKVDWPSEFLTLYAQFVLFLRV
jgi:hypothetical protein